jgi:uncharacterized protein YyaL (SSP411 family)
MRRPSYAVVSYSLLVLALFGLIVGGLRSKIPQPPLNRLRFESSEYLVQGSHSEVDWRPLEPSAFAVARRTGRPILLLIGVPWSKTAREADEQVFSDRDIVSFLNRYMVCIRIDAETEPKWLTAFLPVRRVATPMPVGFQVWFLTPEGQLFDNGGEIGTLKSIDPDTFGDILVRARERLRDIRAGSPNAPIPGADQAADKELLTQSAFNARLDLVKMDEETQAQVAANWGGLMRFGRIRPSPQTLQCLLLRGRYGEFRKMANAMIGSPLVDWLDGGFYRSYVATVPRSLEFDKLAVSNAELMGVLAKAGVILKEPLYTRLAKDTFDSLVQDFVQNGIVVGCQVGDEGPQGRSSRNSFSPRRLREVLSPSEREIARKQLNLRVETNRFMSVWLSDPFHAFDEGGGVAEVLEKLRRARTSEAQFAGRRQVDVHGYVVARLFECARLWGDEARILQAQELFTRLDWFLAGDDVRHTIESGVPDDPYVGDYLAYADAALQCYLAMGSAEVLQSGIRVLKRARFLFETASGVWQMSQPTKDPLGPRDVDVPEVLDLARESCMSQAIRLCNSYGRLFRDPSLLQAAQSASGQFSNLAGNLGMDGAGLVCSLLKVIDDTYVVVSGPHAISRANEIYRAIPTRLVVPAVGSFKAPGAEGIFLIKNGLPTRVKNADEAIAGAASIFKVPG